jgi:hypothetical protein
MLNRIWKIGELSITLQDVLEDKHKYPLNLRNFQDHCLKEHNEENLRFSLEVFKWKTKFEASTSSENISSANMIFSKYISSEAPKKINISSHVQEDVLLRKESANKTNLVSLDIFDNCIQEIEDIIHRDIFPRFISNIEHKLEHNRSKALALWCFVRPLPSLKEFFTFPTPINEAESRLHQCLSTFQMLLCLVLEWGTGYWYGYLYILYGYFVRTLCGPRLCPNAWFVLYVLSPICNRINLLNNVLVPSAPKRFAQGIGTMFALTYVILINFSINPLFARVISIIHISVAFLAAITGFCVGCYVYSIMYRFRSKSVLEQIQDAQCPGVDLKIVHIRVSPVSDHT